MSTTDPSTWKASAVAGDPASRVAYGPDRPDQSHLVLLRLDRHLKSGKLDTMPMTAAEAIKLATDLLYAVQVLERRKR